MNRSSGFGSTSCNSFALLKLAFASAPQLNRLTSLHNVTRRPVLQKVRRHTLFHSPPGVLFTFPSRYYTLSVTRSYLALGDGPPVFPPDSSCPAVLRILPASIRFRLRDRYPLRSDFPIRSTSYLLLFAVLYPLVYCYIKVWALSLSLATTQKIDCFLSFPPGT